MLSDADLALMADLFLLGFAITAGFLALRVIVRLLGSVLRSMAGLIGWAIAVAAVALLLVRLVRFFV
jgi:hypothetical protein